MPDHQQPGWFAPLKPGGAEDLIEPLRFSARPPAQRPGTTKAFDPLATVAPGHGRSGAARSLSRPLVQLPMKQTSTGRPAIGPPG